MVCCIRKYKDEIVCIVGLCARLIETLVHVLATFLAGKGQRGYLSSFNAGVLVDGLGIYDELVERIQTLWVRMP